MSISKQTQLKNDAVNDILERLWQLPEQSRFHVFTAVFSMLVEACNQDPIEMAGRCCAVHKMLKEARDLKQYEEQ
jgi:hypothetical protein